MGLLRRQELDAEEADFLVILATGDDEERKRAEWLLVDRGWSAEELKEVTGGLVRWSRRF